MKHSHLMHTLNLREVRFKGGSGPYLISETEESFLDFFCDVGTASLGYSTPDKMFEDTSTFRIPLHAPNLYGFTTRDRAAKMLVGKTSMDRVFFTNSGTEAVETAIKLARLFHHKRYHETGKSRRTIASYVGGFHGRTGFALAAGDGPPYHTEGFGPLPEGFVKFHSTADIPDDTAAIMLAPVFGNNDVYVYPPSFLRDLRQKANDIGALLIFDEVQTGSGRCGLSFTYAQRERLRPDIMTLAKGLGMGAPVGACLARGPVADTFTPGTHFSTFGGNPLTMKCVLEMMAWATDDALTEVEEKGILLRTELEVLGWTHNVRGPGMLIAFDYDGDTLALGRAAMEQHLLIGAFRAGPGPVKITPPLNITIAQIKEGIAKLARAHERLRETR